jgi:hypothetical protein
VLHVGKIIQFMVVTMHSLFLSCLCTFVIVSSIHNLWDLMGLSLRLDGNMTLIVQRSLCILVLWTNICMIFPLSLKKDDFYHSTSETLRRVVPMWSWHVTWGKRHAIPLEPCKHNRFFFFWGGGGYNKTSKPHFNHENVFNKLLNALWNPKKEYLKHKNHRRLCVHLSKCLMFIKITSTI